MNKVLLLLVIATIFAPAANAGSAEFERRVQENRRRFEQHAAEHRRQFEERTSRLRGASGASTTTRSYGMPGAGGTAAAVGTSGTTNYGTQSTNNSQARTQTPTHQFRYADKSDNMKGTDFNPLAYDAKNAPSPDLCFLKFVATAKTATSMNQLMDFLPFSKSRTLKERQALYDPAVAAQHRVSFKSRDPKMSEESLTHLTQDPFSGELKHCREVAAKVLRVRKIASLNGNKAVLDVGVRAEASQNGAKYPYGIADVEMICEGNYWKFSSYSDHNIFYQEPQ